MTLGVRKSSCFSPSKEKAHISREKAVFFAWRKKRFFLGKRPTNFWILDALGIYIYTPTFWVISSSCPKMGPSLLKLCFSPVPPKKNTKGPRNTSSILLGPAGAKGSVAVRQQDDDAALSQTSINGGFQGISWWFQGDWMVVYGDLVGI